MKHRGSNLFLKTLATRRATTLAELMISMFVTSVLVIIVVNLFVGSSQFVSAEQLRIDVGDNANRILSVLDATLRQGKAIILSSGGYTTGETVLVFTLPSLLTGNVLSATEVDTMAAYLDTSNPNDYVIRLVTTAIGTGSTRTLGSREITHSVKDLYFRYATDDPKDSTSVTVTATTQKTVSGRPFQQALILYVPLRNHP